MAEIGELAKPFDGVFDLTDLPTLLTAELSGPLVAHVRESKVNTNTDIAFKFNVCQN